MYEDLEYELGLDAVPTEELVEMALAARGDYDPEDDYFDDEPEKVASMAFADLDAAGRALAHRIARGELRGLFPFF